MCTGFCRLLNFSASASDRQMYLAIRMVLASLGSQRRGEARSRTVGVVKHTPYLIVTDAFVGVCCTSLKKICDILKRHILEDNQSIAGARRNTTYDGMVTPCYSSYPVNAEACANVTRRDWNPPIEVVNRWI